MHLIEIKVIPSSGKSVLCVDKLGVIKCYLKNPPERNLANQELIKMLAQMVGVTQNAVSIVGGSTSRKKMVKIISDQSKEELYALLGIRKQLSFLK